MKFRKKPVVIEAVRFIPEPGDTIFKFYFDDERQLMQFPIYRCAEKIGLKINTLEGTMEANLGDWIIRGVSGEFYPCKNAIFEKTYEPES